MVGLRRLSICLSIVIFIFVGVVVLGLAVKPASANQLGVNQLEGISSDSFFAPGAAVFFEDALTGTLNSYYFPFVTRSKPILCGEILTDTVWKAVESPYLVTCDVSILAGVKVTAEAGVTLQFVIGAVNLLVYGELRAEGTEQAPIYFQPITSGFPGSWGAVAFMPGSSGVLDHAIIEYGGYISYLVPGMVYIASDAVQVGNSVVRGSNRGGIYTRSSSPVISATLITSNHADQGGGVYIESGNPLIQNNVFSGNTADLGGGGLYINTGSPLIFNNVFHENIALLAGGGIYIHNFNAGISVPTIQNNILVSNTARISGGGISNTGTPVLDYNDIWGNTGGDYDNAMPGLHDISTDPVWVDPDHGDFHLASNSPCIDAGDPETQPDSDFESEPRPMGLAPDIGPDEVRSLGVVISSLADEAPPGSLVTFTVMVNNMTPVSLTTVLFTYTLPMETSFTTYRGEGLTCIHDGPAWGGFLSCSPDNPWLAPDESRTLTVTAILTDTPHHNFVVNTVLATASAGEDVFTARDQARLLILWCKVQLNNLSMGSDIQAAIDASTQAADVVKVSGYCRNNGLAVNKTLTLQGGWSIDFNERNAAVYPTTLDAQNQASVIIIKGDVSVDAVIEGFIITGGAGQGGGIFIMGTMAPTIQNNIIYNNSGISGGGISTYFGAPIIQNNLIIANAAEHGGGINNFAGKPVIVNNIVINNYSRFEGGGIDNEAGEPFLDYNDVWHNTVWDYDGIEPGLHDISTDPVFIDAAYRDYHLAAGSPCIDAGSPDQYSEADFEGEHRPMGPVSDIGVDEVRNFYLEKTVTPVETIPGAPLTYTIELANPTERILDSIQLTDTLPVDVAFTGYQADGLTCVHDGSAWGGRLICTLGNPAFLPGESYTFTMLGNLSETAPLNQKITNLVEATARASGELLKARDTASISAIWCAVRLNDTPMGGDLQAAVDASTQAVDVVKVGGYCRVHDLNLNKTLTLQGGWSKDFGVWDPGVYTTTLDAQQMGRVITVTGAITPTIEFFTITGGKIDGAGAGISIPSGSPTIQHNLFVNNQIVEYLTGHDGRGGGLYNGTGSPLIQGNSFRNNTIYRYAGCYGGGISNDSGSPVIQNNIFAGNAVSGWGLGGGIYIYSGNPVILNNLFTSNYASSSGAGLYNDQDGTPLVQNNTFTHNSTSGYGAGLFNMGPAIIQNNAFIENQAYGEGGGISINGSGTVQNNIFAGNTSIYDGGGLYIWSEDGSSTIIQNNTIYKNSASDGGGLYITGTGSPIIRSNIIVNNTANGGGGGIYFNDEDGGAPILGYNDVWNNTGGDYSGVNPGAHDISSNPRLVDPVNGNFHITSTSPCINKGDPVNYPPTDFEGDLRPHGPAPDIGVDEFYP
jgi:uncharacterized repeat protein (TIGR01451 family)